MYLLSSETAGQRFSYCIVSYSVCYSGKTIPNGTDKLHLGTPENEGTFQVTPRCQVFLFLLCMLG